MKWERLSGNFSSKRISLAALNINMNNLVSPLIYGIFLLAEYVQIIYILALIIQSQIYGINVSETWHLESYLVTESSSYFIFIQLGMILFQISVCLMFSHICCKMNSMEKANEASTLSGILSILLCALHTFIYTAFLSLIARSFFLDVKKVQNGFFIAIQVLNCLNLIVLSSNEVVLYRIVTVKIHVSNIPQA